MTDVRSIRCGACGSDQPRRVGVPRISQQAKAVTPDSEAIRVVKCTRCGFYYTVPMPFWDDETLQTLYDVGYFGDESTWWNHVRTKADPRRRLHAIEKELQQQESSTPELLDIGCGQGYVLEQALQRGWDVWGLEASETWAHQTSARLGVKVWAEAIEEADLPAESRDVVFSDSVAEHLPEPITMLKLARHVLRPGGIAYLVTPNADALVNSFRGLLFRLAGSSRAPYIEPLSIPYHLVGFTPHSLSVLAERAGFEVRQIWVRHGRDEWRKDRRWTPSRLKSLALWPCLAVGELCGRGTTIDALLVRR